MLSPAQIDASRTGLLACHQLASSENILRSMSGAAVARSDGDTQLAQPSNVVTNKALPPWLVQNGFVSLGIRFPGVQDLINQRQNRVSRGNHRWRLRAPRLGGDAPKLVFQKAVLLGRRRPRTLRQRAAQPGITAGGVTALVLVCRSE